MLSLFHLYRWAKGEELYEPSILGSLHSFICFKWLVNQIGSLQNKSKKKKKLERYLM
jgi:hypothetical protein